MRALGRIAIVCVALTLAGAGAARAAEEAGATWGLLVRGGYFGLPDAVADELFNQHPDVKGSSVGAELRYHGTGGGRGIASVGLAIDAASAEGDGLWQSDPGDKVVSAGGEISMVAVTVTGYWSLFPSWYVHPYVGFGIGGGWFDGTYRDKDGERVEVSTTLPVIHVPIGLAVELGEHLQLALEARVLNGVAAGGALQVRF